MTNNKMPESLVAGQEIKLFGKLLTVTEVSGTAWGETSGQTVELGEGRGKAIAEGNGVRYLRSVYWARKASSGYWKTQWLRQSR